ncbi:MAG TPA: hypothetical protein VIZ17_13950 [Acetobacteraceae bacterium]
MQPTGQAAGMAYEASLDDSSVRTSSRAGWGLVALDSAVVLGICIILATVFALHARWMLQNHDVDFSLVIARRILAGGRYMRDFVEANPPLIFFLDAPPALLAAPLGIDAYSAFSLSVCVLIAVSVALSWPIVAWCFQENPVGGRLFLLAYVAILALEPGYDFGQREHLSVILFCPGLFWFAARDIGRPSPITPVSVVIILLAAVAVLIKPFDLSIPAGMLALSAARHRSWRVLWDFPVAVFAAAAVLYAVVTVVAFPGFLPEVAVLRHVYFGWNRAWLTVLDSSRDTVTALSLAIVLTELAPIPPRHRIFLRYGCVASVLCLLMAFMQHKGWPYHFLQSREIALIVLAFVAASLLPMLATQRVRTPVLLAVVAVATVCLALRPLQEGLQITRSRFLARPLIHTLRQMAAGKRVLLLTAGYQMGFPALADVKVGAREPGQSLLPGTVKLELSARTPAQRATAEALRQLATSQLIEDLDRYQPEIVAVDKNHIKQGLPDDFDMLAFYDRDEAFRRVWADYRPTAKIEGWDLYQRVK